MRAEDVGERAGRRLKQVLDLEACVDEHAADQLIIFAALARGTSELLVEKPSLHAMTAMYVAETLLDARFNVEERGSLTLVRCWGAGTASGCLRSPNAPQPL